MSGTAIVLYFHVHQPFRLRRYSWFDVGRQPHHFDDGGNAEIVRRVAERCYVPMTSLLTALAKEHEGRFRCAFSITSTVLEQMSRWAPDALDGFLRLVDTGCAEVVSETSHHSLAFLGDEDEFRAQIEAQSDRLEATFGQRPVTFRNTELIIDANVARIAEELGFRALLGEGADHLLGWLPTSDVYRPHGTERLKLLLRNYRFSDDIAFRFSNRGWEEWPLSAAKFSRWMHEVAEDARQVGLFMDFETAGEHQWEETGIFEFMRHMPGPLLDGGRFRFLTPGEAAAEIPAERDLELPFAVSWADAERDLSAWLGNPMQRAAHAALYDILPDVRRAAAGGRTDLLEAWRKMSTSDHVYYMATKGWTDGEVHEYFSPFDSPHAAHVTFMNALDDLARRAASAAREPAAAVS